MKMEQLDTIIQKLNEEFKINLFGKDQSFSRFVPIAYESNQFPWENEFEENFTKLFNGLMIKGSSAVNNVFLAVFPTNSVLERFIEESCEGDLLFMHHPLVMECGDPRGKWGRGFIPIEEQYIYRIKKKNLSIY